MLYYPLLFLFNYIMALLPATFSTYHLYTQLSLLFLMFYPICDVVVSSLVSLLLESIYLLHLPSLLSSTFSPFLPLVFLSSFFLFLFSLYVAHFLRNRLRVSQLRGAKLKFISFARIYLAQVDQSATNIIQSIIDLF